VVACDADGISICSGGCVVGAIEVCHKTPTGLTDLKFDSESDRIVQQI